MYQIVIAALNSINTIKHNLIFIQVKQLITVIDNKFNIYYHRQFSNKYFDFDI